MNKPQWIIVHHEAPPVTTNSPRFGVVNEYHKLKGFPKSSLGYFCGYHLFIEKSGLVWKAREDFDIGAHTIGYNDKSLGVCLAGNFDIEMPTEAQKTALRSVLKEKTIQYGILPLNIVPHRKFSQKTCYGSKLPDTWAADLLTKEEKISVLQSVLNSLWKTLQALMGKR